jgi:hypothetical protein
MATATLIRRETPHCGAEGREDGAGFRLAKSRSLPRSDGSGTYDVPKWIFN